jgi:hypothetical protein
MVKVAVAMFLTVNNRSKFSYAYGFLYLYPLIWCNFKKSCTNISKEK